MARQETTTEKEDYKLLYGAAAKAFVLIKICLTDKPPDVQRALLYLDTWRKQYGPVPEQDQVKEVVYGHV